MYVCAAAAEKEREVHEGEVYTGPCSEKIQGGQTGIEGRGAVAPDQGRRSNSVRRKGRAAD